MKLTDKQEDALNDLVALGMYIAGIEINTGVNGLLVHGCDGNGRSFTLNLSELMRDVAKLTFVVLLANREAKRRAALSPE